MKDVIAGSPRALKLAAGGGLLAALAASSCCILPLALFGLGVGGAWIGNFTQLAPYQPYFIAAALAFIACGYGLVYRQSKIVCTDGDVCARPLPNKLVKTGLILATVLVAAALSVNLFAASLFVS